MTARQIRGMTCTRAHRKWREACRASARIFDAALNNPGDVQRRLLRRILSAHVRTVFGREHAFRQIRTMADYRKAVPVRPYAGFASWMERIAHGEERVLTADRVERLLPTSGTEAVKWIPWTAAAHRGFLHAVRPWIFGLYRDYPAMTRGSMYWSISPPVPAPVPPGRRAVGFASDAEYLDATGRAVFPHLARVIDPPPAGNDFAVETFARLALDDRLAFISIWSPTFLSTVIGAADRDPRAVMAAVARAARPGDAHRVNAVQSILQQRPGVRRWHALWPRLALISCWTDGPSALYARALARRFPGVPIQGKGVVATEALVSVPVARGIDPVPAVRSTVLEFEDARGELAPDLRALKTGDTYAVIVTTPGGLYRYRLGDRVTVTGRYGHAPTLRFAGREGAMLDRFGEKLSADFIERSVRAVCRRKRVRPRFILLTPGEGAWYELYLAVETPRMPAPHLPAALEDELRTGYHYDVARKLGQLDALRVFLVDTGRCDPDAVFLSTLEARGLKRGDIKPSVIDREGGWDRRFAGCWL